MNLFATLLVGSLFQSGGQDTLHLAAMQRAAMARDPRVQQLELRAAASALRLQNIDASALPQFQLVGKAEHWSEVPSLALDLPGAATPGPPKDRLELALSSDWNFYDGGQRGAQRRVEQAQLAAERAQVLVDLYSLRSEVTEAYFTALLQQEAARAANATIEDLNARLGEVRAAVGAGAALPGDTAALLAELLGVTQQRDELLAQRRASLRVLAQLTGVGIAPEIVQAIPELSDDVARAQSLETPRVHPQFDLFTAQRERLAQQMGLIDRRDQPRASAFGQVAYGRPGLEQFSDHLHAYWLAGVRVSWAPWDWGSARREGEVLRLEQQVIDKREAAFAEQLERRVQPLLEQIVQLTNSLALDDQIIALREQVTRQARAQFAERAITASAYVDALTDLQEARVTRVRRRAELARMQAEYLITLGIEDSGS